MRSFGVITAIAVYASYVTALPSLPSFGFGAGNGCLTEHSAYELVKSFIQLTNGDAFNAKLAKQLIIEDIVDTSGSVASVINSGKSIVLYTYTSQIEC